MLRDWLVSRPPRALERGRSFRPTLERLEDRLAPSGNPHGGDNGPPGHDQDHGPPGPPAQVHVNNNNNVHINAHDSFNTNINDSFNTAVNNITVNQFTTTVNNTTITQTFQTNLVLSAQQNFGAAVSLVLDEFQLAAATYLTLAGGPLAAQNPTLAADMHGLQSAIQQNPLEASANGAQLGSMAFNMTLQNILASQSGQGQS